MTYVITQPCIDTLDKSCVDVCPVDCIHLEAEVDRKLYIDPDECIDCAACEPVCPVFAIFAEDDVPLEQRPFIEIDASGTRTRSRRVSESTRSHALHSVPMHAARR